jgi:hypothetical protein
MGKYAYVFSPLYFRAKSIVSSLVSTVHTPDFYQGIKKLLQRTFSKAIVNNWTD